MKLVTSLLVLLMSTHALAASNKICFGSKQNEYTDGAILSVSIGKANVSIKNVRDSVHDYGGSDNGTYPASKKTVNGRDGKTYLVFDGDSSEMEVSILIDSELLKKGTTGLLKIQGRGETFFNSVYFCKDPQQKN